jgi:hypothetical protein
MSRFLALFLCLATVSTHAQNLGFERILLPVYNAPVAGAGGSDWRTELLIHNRSNTAVLYYPGYFQQPGRELPGQPVPPQPFIDAIRARTTAEVAPLRSDGMGSIIPERTPISARILHIERPEDVTVQLFVRDVSRDFANFGTRIPTPRESEFTSEPLRLIGINARTDFRKTLRIYDLDRRDDASVHVRLLHVERRGGEAQLIAERIFPLHVATPEPGSPYAGDTTFPGYAELEIESAFASELAAASVDRFNHYFEVEVTPLTPRLRIWSMVSVTSNETQHVSIIAP